MNWDHCDADIDIDVDSDVGDVGEVRIDGIDRAVAGSVPATTWATWYSGCRYCGHGYSVPYLQSPAQHNHSVCCSRPLRPYRPAVYRCKTSADSRHPLLAQPTKQDISQVTSRLTMKPENDRIYL